MENGFNKFTVIVSDAEKKMENLKGRVSKIQKNVDSSLITHGNHLGLFLALNNAILVLFSGAGSIPRFGVSFGVSFVTLILSVIGVVVMPFFYGYSRIRLIRYGIRDLLTEVRNLMSEIHYLRNRYEMYRDAANYMEGVSDEFRTEVEDLKPRVYRLSDFQEGFGNNDELQILRATDRMNTKIVKICRIIALCAVIYTVVFVGVLLCTGMNNHRPPPPAADNYTLALRKALMFFNAQRSGKLPKHNNVTWRGNSGLNDGKSDTSSISKNLVGGYYDAGDASKFNFPASFAMTMLSWSVIEYSAKYDAAGELTHVKEIIKWGTDFFLKTFNSSADTIDRVVAQVGVGDTSRGPSPNDHYCWMHPEDIDYPRPVTECHSCSDLVAEMAAALASASIVFKDNKAYSQKLVHGAKTLFKFARDQRGIYSMGSEAAIFYNSTSYWDEFVWGGAWMYYATGNNSYLSLATNIKMATHAGAFWGGPDYGVLSWDNKLAGAQVLLTRLRLFLSPRYPYEEALKTFHNQTSIFMCSFLPYFTSFNRTKGGLIQLNHGRPQPLQYVVNAAFLATVYSDYLDAADTPGWYCGPNFYLTKTMRKFAESQIDYILGKNPLKMSYLVGFGNHYPKHVHHRGASIPTNKVKYSCKGGWKWRDTSKPNPNTIVGAMVAGPDRHDGFRDVRTNYNYTEPTLAGNAGLVAALVALSGEPKARQIDKNTMFSAVPPVFFTVPPAPWKP